MKLKLIHFTKTLALLTIFATAGLVWAQTTARYDARPGSKLTIDGTATTGSWQVECALIGGFAEFDAAFPVEPGGALKAQPKVEIMVPARSLKSGKKLMDSVMLDAMKAEQHPRIEYKLLEMKPKGSPLDYEATGVLKIAGVTRTNIMPVKLEFLEGGKRLKVTGSSDLKMTDFGITPPAPASLGLFKTGDDITVSFEWITARKAEAVK